MIISHNGRSNATLWEVWCVARLGVGKALWEVWWTGIWILCLPCTVGGLVCMDGVSQGLLCQFCAAQHQQAPALLSYKNRFLIHLLLTYIYIKIYSHAGLLPGHKERINSPSQYCRMWDLTALTDLHKLIYADWFSLAELLIPEHKTPQMR